MRLQDTMIGAVAAQRESSAQARAEHRRLRRAVRRSARTRAAAVLHRLAEHVDVAASDRHPSPPTAMDDADERAALRRAA